MIAKPIHVERETVKCACGVEFTRKKQHRPKVECEQCRYRRGNAARRARIARTYAERRSETVACEKCGAAFQRIARRDAVKICQTCKVAKKREDKFLHDLNRRGAEARIVMGPAPAMRGLPCRGCGRTIRPATTCRACGDTNREKRRA